MGIFKIVFSMLISREIIVENQIVSLLIYFCTFFYKFNFIFNSNQYPQKNFKHKNSFNPLNLIQFTGFKHVVIEYL